MKNFFLRFFTWWNGQTFGTQLWTRLYGEFVGEDEFANRYYRTKGGKIDPAFGFERRWVMQKSFLSSSRRKLCSRTHLNEPTKASAKNTMRHILASSNLHSSGTHCLRSNKRSAQ